MYELEEITRQIEDILQRNILENTVYDWNEEFIIRSILKEIRNRINGKKINDGYSINSIKFNAFQLNTTLKTTQKYGDIAFIINTEFNSGEKIEGIGFIEAKIRTKKTNKFNSIGKTQLIKIYKNAPHSLLLLLDYEPIMNIIPSYNDYQYYRHSNSKTYSVVSQINTALNLNSKTTSLYKISYPFSYQITHRYFYGLDLEYDNKIKKDITGFANKKDLPKFAVFITIAPVNKNDNENNDDIIINRDYYEEL